MAQPSKAAAQKPADPTIPAKSNKKLLIAIIGVLVLAIAGGAGWYFTKGKKPHDATEEHVEEEVKADPHKLPIFVALEPFTVNLQRESTDQYLQLGLSLKVFEPDYENKIKLNLPEIRSKILQLLTTKTATELLTADGKTKLIREILTLSNGVIGIVEPPVQPMVIYAAPPGAAPQGVNASGVPVTVAIAPAHAGAGAPATLPAAVSAPVYYQPQPAPHVPKKGIVDVLLTSFIIQ
jgi:flagellar FliL protein